MKLQQSVPPWNENLEILAFPSNLYSEDEDPEYKPLRMPFKDDMDDFTNSPLDDKDDTVEGEAEGKLWIHPDTEGEGERCSKKRII